jgi:hypothetical protein
MKRLFAGEVYIRLEDNQAGFVCTVKYGRFDSKETGFALHQFPTPDVLNEKVGVFARKRSSRRAASDER